MNWVRCRRCRTVGDREAATSCLGCGTPFHEAPAAATPARLQAKAKTDLHAATSLLGVLGLLGGTGLVLVFVLGDTEAGPVAALADFVLLTLFFASLLGRRIGRARFSVVAKVFLGVAALGAAFFGALVLVLLACAPALSNL